MQCKKSINWSTDGHETQHVAQNSSTSTHHASQREGFPSAAPACSSSWHTNSSAPWCDSSPVFSLYVLGVGGRRHTIEGWCGRETSWLPLAYFFWGLGGLGDASRHITNDAQTLAEWSHITSDCADCTDLKSFARCCLSSSFFPKKNKPHLCQSANTLGLVVIAASHLHCSVWFYHSCWVPPPNWNDGFRETEWKTCRNSHTPSCSNKCRKELPPKTFVTFKSK